MNKYQKIFTFLFLFSIFYFLFSIFAQSKTVDLYYFSGQGCPYCEQMKSSLIEIQKEFPELKINELEIFFNPQNQKLLKIIAEAYEIKIEGVPVVFVGDLAVQGFDQAKVLQVKEKIRFCSSRGCPSPLEKLKQESGKKQNGRFSNLLIFGLVGGLIILFISLFLLKEKKKN